MPPLPPRLPTTTTATTGCEECQTPTAKSRCVFQTAAAQLIQRTMKPFWRAMEKGKLNVLVPNNTLEHDTWVAAMLQYQRREPLNDSTPAMASFYRISALALSRVQTDLRSSSAGRRGHSHGRTATGTRC
jgi:hypothetical protein